MKTTDNIGEHIAKSLLGNDVKVKQIHVIFNNKYDFSYSCYAISTVFNNLGLDFLSVSVSTHDLSFTILDTPLIDSHCLIELKHDFKSVEEFYAHLHKALEEHIETFRRKQWYKLK